MLNKSLFEEHNKNSIFPIKAKPSHPIHFLVKYMQKLNKNYSIVAPIFKVIHILQ